MLPPDNFLQKITAQNEEKTRKRFKRQGFNVEVLDKDRSGSRPDFYVFKSPKEAFICEVKTVFSVGTLDHGLKHISTLDINLSDGQPHAFSYSSFPKTVNVLGAADKQYKALISQRKQFGSLPFVLAFYPDLYADNINLIPRDLFGFTNVSAIAQLERDFERGQAIRKLSHDKLWELLQGKWKMKLPKNSLQWRVLKNRHANHPIKTELLQPCIEN